MLSFFFQPSIKDYKTWSLFLKYLCFILAEFSNDVISPVRDVSTNNYIQIWCDVILVNANIVFILFYVIIFFIIYNIL